MATIQMGLSLSDLVEKLIKENNNSGDFLICELFERLSLKSSHETYYFNLIVRHYECYFGDFLHEKEKCRVNIINPHNCDDVRKISTDISDNTCISDEDFDGYILELIQTSSQNPKQIIIHNSNTLSNIRTILSHNYGVNADVDEISSSLVRVCYNLITSRDERFNDEIPEEQ